MAAKSRTRTSIPAIALVGPGTFLGRRTLAWLSEQATGPLIVIDAKRPESLPPEARFYKVDLTQPTADSMLVDIFRTEGVDTVLHLGQYTRPQRAEAKSHEYEVIGTFHLLNAVAAAGVRKLVAASSTLVYGADPLNPNYLSESSPFRVRKSYKFVADKVEAEQLFAQFRQRHKDKILTVLRFAPTLGPTVHNYVSASLDLPVVVTLLGFDPLIQLLHESDALRAVQAALSRDYNGPVNIVPQDVVPLSTILFRAGRVNLPVAHPLAYPMVATAWSAGLSPVPSEHLDYIRYLYCADGELAQTVLDFTAEYRTGDTLASYASVRRLRRFATDGGGA